MTQEVNRDVQEVLAALHQGLRELIGRERFELWFGRQVRLELDGRRLLVSAPDQFVLDRVRKLFRRELADVAGHVVAGEVELEFRVAAPVASTSAPTSPTLNEDSAERQPPPAAPVTEPPARPPRQPARTPKAFDSFVMGSGNRVAVTAARTVCERPGNVSPLLLYGPPGCGKSHLQEAICVSVRQSLGLRRVVSLSSEQFTSLFLDALQGSGLPNFRRKCRDVDVLAIDDIQFFAGKRATLVELQHTIDALLRQGRQLILTADRPPSELGHLGPELVMRITGGLLCAIEPADFDTRLAMARQFAVRCRCQIPEEVLQLLAAELSGDARQIVGALNRLDAASAAYAQPVTLEFARKSLEDIFRATVCVVRLPDIERAICHAFDLEPKALRNGRKVKSVSHPRMLAMWLARKYTRAASSEISEYFGRRSHSTVISAEKKVNRWVAEGAVVQLGSATCNIEDALRRVEGKLRTG